MRMRRGELFCEPMSAENDARLSADFFAELASELLAHRELEMSFLCSNEALHMGVDAQRVLYERWMYFMLRGEFENAWCEADIALTAGRTSGEPPADTPFHLRRVWDGSAVEGRNVLVRCFHGLGDTIQFVRYVPLLKKVAARVYLECQSELVRLLEMAPGMDGVLFVSNDADAAEDRVEIEMMELPYAFRTTMETIPREVPYLRVPPLDTQNERRGFPATSFKIGLAWSSGDWDPQRDIRLGQLLPLRAIPGIAFFSVQRGAAAREIGEVPELQIIQTERESGTTVDTAATIHEMDLIISVDTMVAHLAGALGKPSWLLLPYCADWRWMIAREDSPWYPTMRIFRQIDPGDWEPVIASVTASLERSLRPARKSVSA
jgi:hypothetical protein